MPRKKPIHANKPRARKVSAISLANLRPLGLDPVQNRINGLTKGLHGPLSTHKRCTAMARSTGKPCRNPAAYGSERCKNHAKGSMVPLHRRTARAERNATSRAARLWLDDHPPPLELTRHPVWIEAMGWFGGARYTRQRALVLAYTQGTETGDWLAWRGLLKQGTGTGTNTGTGA